MGRSWVVLGAKDMRVNQGGGGGGVMAGQGRAGGGQGTREEGTGEDQEGERVTTWVLAAGNKTPAL